MQHCSTLAPRRYLCNFGDLCRDTNNICEVHLQKDTSKCIYYTSSFHASIWHKIAKNQRIFLLSHMEDLTIHQTDGVTSTFTVPLCGIMTLPYGSTATTQTCLFSVGTYNKTHMEKASCFPQSPYRNLVEIIWLRFPTSVYLCSKVSTLNHCMRAACSSKLPWTTTMLLVLSPLYEGPITRTIQISSSHGYYTLAVSSHGYYSLWSSI